MTTQNTFDNEAQIYEFTSRAVNIFFDEALDTLVNNIETQKKNPIILDVCCGTCILTEKVAKKYPDAKFYGVDFSIEMLKIGQERMKSYDFTPILGDICDKKTFQSLPQFDMIISSFGIHNVHGIKQKQLALNNLMSCLKNGGLFITCDYIKGEDKARQKHFDDVLKNWLLKTYSAKETEDWIKLLREEDDPETIEDNLTLLKNAGCPSPKLIWNKEYLATLQATKSKEKLDDRNRN